MKQKRKQSMSRTTFIGPSKQILTEINQDILDVQRCLDTNMVIIKNTSKDANQNKIKRTKNKKLNNLKDITQELSEPENWNEFKKHTSKSIQNNVSDELEELNKHMNRFAKSTIQKSSDVVSRGKHAISKNTPKMSNSISKSIRGWFGRKKSLDQKDLDLLEKLAELKQQGILSSKEFALKKKQILTKLC